MRKFNIGYVKYGYAERRNIIYSSPTFNYIKVKNYLAIAMNFLKKLGWYSGNINNIFNDFGINNVHLIHLFNAISGGNTPWISTFESILPRYKASHDLFNNNNSEPTQQEYKNVEKDIIKMARSSCKKLIALSESAKYMQLEYLRKFPAYEKTIASKISVLHPPQKSYLKTWDEKNVTINKEIRFIMVGGLFFLKGGREVLDVLTKIRAKKYNVKLILISSILTDNFASDTTQDDVLKIKNDLETHSDWITYYKSLSNEEVLAQMKIAHVGLLPSYGDTYGYSVLEMQSMGCPVITTDIRALPEINNNEVGWLIKVPKNKYKGAMYSSDETREELSQKISEGLYIIISDIYRNPEQIKEKANRSIERIQEYHSPKKFAEKMTEIYDIALNKRMNNG